MFGERLLIFTTCYSCPQLFNDDTGSNYFTHGDKHLNVFLVNQVHFNISVCIIHSPTNAETYKQCLFSVHLSFLLVLFILSQGVALLY